jgi:hypothetical protein
MKLNKLIVPSIIMLVLIAALATRAQALSIPEVESNDTLATAQVLAPAAFTTGSNADIANATTIPWVSISGTGNGTFDYYSFTVANAGYTGFFDIDHAMDATPAVDLELGLWDTAGNLLAFNGDGYATVATEALGSVGPNSGWDAFIEHTFSSSGTYIVGVADFVATAGAGGWLPGSNVIPDGRTYTLQVSIREAIPNPEPTTILLMGIGVLGLVGGTARKQLKKRADMKS